MVTVHNSHLVSTWFSRPTYNPNANMHARLRAGLLCLAQAKEGGLSAWSSSVTVHNEIVKRAPELARVLAQRGAW